VNMRHFFLRRHEQSPGSYWYEVIESVKEFPLGVAKERHVVVVHSEATGTLFVDALNRQRREGIIEGLTRFAWWKDGCQYVGTCGTTLAQAIDDLDRGKW
jgi:hypothetical protein